MSDPHPGYANLANLQMIEELFAVWLENPEGVDLSWQHFFEGMQLASALPKALPARQESSDLRVHGLIQAYRTYGHLYAKWNPIATEEPSFPEELKLEPFGLSEGDTVPTFGLLEKDQASVGELVEALQGIYCCSVGFEYMVLGSREIEEWIQARIEPIFPKPISNEEKKEILGQLNKAEGFETFLHRKYVGQKRFSLEGAESFIPLVDGLLERAASQGVTDGVIGMAHRGRLNVLANVLGKSYAYIFQEFEDTYTPDLSESTGDVKYHMGFTGAYPAKDGEVHLTLMANPSHLEGVDPVTLGGARALQEEKGREKVLPILIHGDAALAGQGVIYESMTLSRLKGYTTGGTLHIVINNQIGFTTLPGDSRSTRYATDIAKAFGAPVFRVNAEDPESCLAVARLAVDLRHQFGCDVFIDLMGYRKYGHNEGDEPKYTQPLQYQIIGSKKTIRSIYRDRLIHEGVLSEQEATANEEAFKGEMNQTLESIKSEAPKELATRPEGKDLEALFAPVETAVDEQQLRAISGKINTPPDGVNLHPKIVRLLQERQKMLDTTLDWGMGELLAYGSLAAEGTHVRLSGQDVRRGTFSHRHALLVDQVNSQHYFPLSHIVDGQAAVDVFNSPLSEYGVLGFDFGYSLLYSNSLVLWEAQFGDFANGGQVMIDQFFASSEMKWGESTNCTLLLPHGYEGMGPEHSSARIERYLQLAAHENMIIANCTTPAQLFHFLRRQALRTLKKPGVLFTPKAFLRHPACRSPLTDLTSGHFEEFLDDPNPPESPSRLLLCSGKFFYDLLSERDKRGANDAIIRIEQLYPLNTEKLHALLEKYPSAQTHLYVQEEHENIGAWSYIHSLFPNLQYIGRDRAASTAAGSHALHKLQHQTLLETLYGEGSSS